MSTTTTAKQKYLEALEALQNARTEISGLHSRQSDLSTEQSNAASTIEQARAALDEAVAAGDQAGIDAADSAIAEARRKEESCAEQIASISRVIERRNAEKDQLLSAAQSAHRLAWKEYEAAAIRRAQDASAWLLRAYRAARNADPRDSQSLADYLNGSDISDGILGEIGITTVSVRDTEIDDAGIPASMPF
ncbi:MAG TPA: hypothetical protein VK971_07505 [Thiohalobacter sp.]|nr:hypothetical protein [Thiohalobacter sp.]